MIQYFSYFLVILFGCTAKSSQSDWWKLKRLKDITRSNWHGVTHMHFSTVALSFFLHHVSRWTSLCPGLARKGEKGFAAGRELFGGAYFFNGRGSQMLKFFRFYSILLDFIQYCTPLLAQIFSWWLWLNSAVFPSTPLPSCRSSHSIQFILVMSGSFAV